MRRPDLEHRSSCPISSSLDVIGDRWSLLVVRDLLFAGARTYKEFLSSGEGIATNILANRLEHLETSGIITSRRDAADGRKLIYRLTPKGLDLVPVLMELSLWGVKHERGVGPRAVIQKWRANREALLAEIRAQWQDEEASPGAERADPAPPTRAARKRRAPGRGSPRP